MKKSTSQHGKSDSAGLMERSDVREAFKRGRAKGSTGGSDHSPSRRSRGVLPYSAGDGLAPFWPPRAGLGGAGSRVGQVLTARVLGVTPRGADSVRQHFRPRAVSGPLPKAVWNVRKPVPLYFTLTGGAGEVVPRGGSGVPFWTTFWPRVDRVTIGILLQECVKYNDRSQGGPGPPSGHPPPSIRSPTSDLPISTFHPNQISP